MPSAPLRAALAALAALAAIVMAVVVGGGTPSAAAAAGGALLPDLDQETPAQLRVAPTGNREHQRWWLGFNSAMSNVGAGPLTIVGHRADTSTPAMVADQLITVPGQDPELVH